MLTQTGSPALRPEITSHMCARQSVYMQRVKNQTDGHGEAMVGRGEGKESPPKPSPLGFSQTGWPGPLAPAKRVYTSRLGPPSHTKILKKQNKTKNPNSTIIVLLSRAKLAQSNLSFYNQKVTNTFTVLSLHLYFLLHQKRTWTARTSNQSILREISPEYSLERLMLKLKLQYLGHLM